MKTQGNNIFKTNLLEVLKSIDIAQVDIDHSMGGPTQY